MKISYSNQEYLKNLTHHLKPKLAFPGKHKAEAWRVKLRAKLIELMGGFPDKCPLEPQLISEEERKEYILKKLAFQSEAGVWVPAYLLLPKQLQKPAAAVLAVHGHGRGKDDVVGVGIAEEKSQSWLSDHNYDYASQFARRGYIVLAPDARGFGERRAGSEKGCYIPGVISLFLGKPIIGQRTWDDMRAIDYLQTLPEVDPNRIGCAGLSEGGKRTLYLSALEERVKVAVVSGYFCALKSTIQHWDAFSGWDICNYLPGLLPYADYPDVASLIAPRALLIENGIQDGLYPLESVKEAFAAVKSAYEQLGFADRVDFDLFEGGHKFSGAKAFDWVDRWLLKAKGGRRSLKT